MCLCRTTHLLTRQHALLPKQQPVRLISQKVKEFFNIEKKKEESRDAFQTWVEFQGRGFEKPQYMQAWVIEKYGKFDEVIKKETLCTPSNKITSNIDQRKSYLQQQVRHPNEVLVKVHAASLNPIDIMICQGYGKKLFNIQRNFITRGLTFFPYMREIGHDSEFPLTVGRDFSGTVVDVGTQVYDLKPGDDVYGAPSVYAQGTLSDYVCVELDHVVQKPQTLSHIEAASIPYVALTVVSALADVVKKSYGHKYKNALVLGGSGGIGTFAIQYLQAYGYNVTTTCSTAGIPLCNSLNADCINYQEEEDIEASLVRRQKFNIVFDAVGAVTPEWSQQFLVRGGTFSTLRSPVVNNADRLGPLMGISESVAEYAKKKLTNSNIDVQWAFYHPNRKALLEVARLIDGNEIKPIVLPKNIYPFEDTKKAFESLATGHTKGKIVVNVSGLPEAVEKPDVEKIIHL